MTDESIKMIITEDCIKDNGQSFDIKMIDGRLIPPYTYYPTYQEQTAKHINHMRTGPDFEVLVICPFCGNYHTHPWQPGTPEAAHGKAFAAPCGNGSYFVAGNPENLYRVVRGRLLHIGEYTSFLGVNRPVRSEGKKVILEKCPICKCNHVHGWDVTQTEEQRVRTRAEHGEDVYILLEGETSPIMPKGGKK